MVAVPGQPATLLAVWDSYYSQSNIFRIDVSEKPAVITESLTIRGGTGDYDPEGIAIAPDRTLWIASEGNASDSRPNLLLQVDFSGNVIEEVGLPSRDYRMPSGFYPQRDTRLRLRRRGSAAW